MVKIGMVIGDRYEVLEKIGTGGMSDVYKAKDHKLNRLVAVKVLKQEFSENENFVSKFRVEAQSTAGLLHPNTVNVYDVGDEDGINYIVMELVDGITLKKYIEKKSRLSVKEAVSIAIQVAMGLEAAHNNGIIHRDIKPQNIMISKEGKVKVTDFGIAKAATSNTITSNVMGSVHYTSPEQARGGYSDAKSDIYSLGITLFEMLTGRVPFNGDTTVAIAIKHIQEDLPSPVEYNDEIPISVEKIVLKCCQKSPDRRYQSAAELIADLKKSLITPDKDFVNLVDPDEEGATRVASEEEMREADDRLAESETMRLKTDVMGEYDEDDRYDDYDDGRRKKRSDYDEMEDLYDYDRPRQPRRRPAQSNQNNNKIEKMTIVMAIISAALVGFIVILLLGRSLGLFGGSDESSENASSELSSVTESGDNADGIQIPDVSGKTYAEAVSILQDDKGFKVTKEADSKNTAAKDTVVSTSPSAGERAKSGATIKLYVSDGSNYDAKAATTEVSTAVSEGQVTVPNVIGMTEEDAVIALVEAGLQQGTIVQTSNEDANLTGKICAQSIAFGTSVSEGTKINMELSTGPATVTYSYDARIDAPTEGENYNYGIPVKVTLVTSDGTTLLSTTTSDFPVVGNYKGITAPTGTITFVYTATTPTTTNPETGETTGGQPVDYTVTRAVTFTQEN
ncbi:Stk1 family PASTA domain-containing Ser/Thr kinase [Butyrivibrio sp. CB08]|uniref:Stk1 family PASTA domain-containing Ser/Thr kinase n=1 Tax=Butyrivibrio sp. CB08 TaxID=2364879 RepID=UPI000EA9D6E8|nr:Stk1 family PASTA domain-containing Ser/Thr kinase [Butyrivibrio sp. CB08]RKM61265.1 Stk1 family PASTA domain-containing Ser/Thr kinase [Butyrivibrio sp. CB08]